MTVRHPLHPPLVHFPLALLATSWMFDLAAVLAHAPVFWTIAFWNVALGLSIGTLAAVAGLVDSARVPADAPAAPLVNRHMLVELGALAVYGMVLFVRGGAGEPHGAARVATLALEGVGSALVLFGGWLGGEMVYRHGVGRVEPRALPREQVR